MTMQKSCQNSQQLQRQQQQYVRPDSPPPSAIKKSPLDMLVETCSSIGQELSKTSKPTDIAVQFESRKPRITTSPMIASSKPDSPTYHQQQKALSLGSLRQMNSGTQQNSKQLSATATLGSHYQLMYQQLLYQAELEYLRSRNKETSATPSASKKMAESQLSSGVVKPSCGICSLSPGYVRGQCVHENPSSLNQMLAMLNPGSAAATVLAYSSKVASLNQTYIESSMSRAGYPLPLLKGWEGSRASPPSAHTVDSRRTSANSSTSTLSPTHRTSPQLPSYPAEQPIDLQVQKSKRSPDSNAVRLIECHWVGAEGYCGKRFHSQDDLMKHLKIHVITCPNVVTTDDEPGRISCGSSRPRSRTSPSTTESTSYKHSSANLSAILSKRFHPYSITDRGFSNMLLTPR